jgi:hypothetical protein
MTVRPIGRSSSSSGSDIASKVKSSTSDIGSKVKSGMSGMKDLGSRISSAAKGGATAGDAQSRVADALNARGLGGGIRGGSGFNSSKPTPNGLPNMGGTTPNSSDYGGSSTPNSSNSYGGGTTPQDKTNPYSTDPLNKGGYSSNLKTGNQQLDQWDDEIMAASKEFGVPPALLKGMIDIESGGDPNAYRGADGYDSVPAQGLMQIKGAYHADKLPGADFAGNPADNIRLGAKIMADAYAQYGSWEAALKNVFFPGDDTNGTTQGGYWDRLKGFAANLGETIV